MDWWQAITVMATVVLAAVGATAWMHRELRKQDKELAAIKSEQELMRQNFVHQNQMNDVTFKHFKDSIDHRLGAATQQKPPVDGGVRP